jgi:hypothetical protein
LERVARDERSSLFGQGNNDNEKGFVRLTTGATVMEKKFLDFHDEAK